MKVTFFSRNARAFAIVDKIAKENLRSIRFQFADGTYMTVKKDNIISIEEV